MFLSKSGLDLSQIWDKQTRSLEESDEHIERLRRQVNASPDTESREALIRHLRRAGRHEEANHRELSPHVRELQRNYETFRRAQGDTSISRGDAKRARRSFTRMLPGVRRMAIAQQRGESENQTWKHWDDAAHTFARALDPKLHEPHHLTDLLLRYHGRADQEWHKSVSRGPHRASADRKEATRLAKNLETAFHHHGTGHTVSVVDNEDGWGSHTVEVNHGTKLRN